LSAGQYTVTATDAIGCADTVSVWVGQPADSLRVQITQSRIACFQESNGMVEAVASGGNGGPFTYLWSTGALTPSLHNLPKTDLQLTVTDSKGCTRVASFQAKEYEPVLLNVIASIPTCYGYADAKAILNKIKGGVAVDTTGRYDLFSYTWSHPGAPDSDTLLFVPAGTYTVTATDSLGCSGTKEFVIKDQQRILIQMEKKDVSCFGLNDGFAKVANAVGLYPIVGYAWSNGTNGSSNPSLPPGTHTVTLTDTHGCRQADSVQVLEPPPIAIAFTASELTCSGDETAIIQADISGGVPAYTLSWNTGASSSTLTRLGAGTYVLKATDQNGCIFQDSVAIASPDTLMAQVEVTDARCYGQTNGRLRIYMSGGQSPYRYSLDGSDFKGSSVFVGLPAGAYTLHVRDNKGCTLSVSATVQQPPPLQVSLGPDLTIVLRDSLLLTAQVTDAGGMVEYAWRSAWQDTMRCVRPDSCAAVWVRPLYLNTYTVRVTDENGCFGEAHIRVEVEKPRGVFVPTGFSPNADGANDRLSVYGKSAQVKRILRFQVYDRWGELLFEDADFAVNDPDRGWDGQYRGQACDPGTYVWYAEAEYWDGYREVVSGGTVLLR
ncbi:MAG TPA: gliding motility-associated C-terminal domain-containing protein, partial [Saprospiraceae bacterium]|nr:gliding motility-associated C-terminal domain-containing protein [Saprospiraceae bacterium]